MPLPQDLRAFARELAAIPWKSTLHTLGKRFRDDRLGVTASSLTFTTTIALVPLMTVALAVFSAFPMFGRLQGALQNWLVESLVPDNIARQVLSYLTQFAGQAGRLGAAGLAILVGTALALILTIDHTLNRIWRVRRRRPLAQRMLVYWAAMTLGPLLLAGSATLTSYAVTASKGLVAGMPGGVGLVLDAIQYGVLAGSIAALYHYIPYTYVKWRQREVSLEADLRAATGKNDFTAIGKLENQLQSIRDGYRRMSIWPLIEAGEFSAISQGEVTAEDLSIANGTWTGWVERKVNQLKEPFRTPARYALITRDTTLFQGLARAVQYGEGNGSWPLGPAPLTSSRDHRGRTATA